MINNSHKNRIPLMHVEFKCKVNNSTKCKVLRKLCGNIMDKLKEKIFSWIEFEKNDFCWERKQFTSQRESYE